MESLVGCLIGFTILRGNENFISLLNFGNFWGVSDRQMDGNE